MHDIMYNHFGESKIIAYEISRLKIRIMLGLNKRNGWTIFSLYLVKFSNIEANEVRAIKIFCRYMIANDERSIGI